MATRSPLVWAFAAALSLVALPAAAQQVNQLQTSVNRSVLGSRDCDTVYQVTVQASLNGQPVADATDRWTVSVSDKSDCTGGTEISRTPTASGQSGTYTFTLTGDEIFEAATGSTCPGEGLAETAYVCATWSNEGGSDVRSGAKVEIDTAGPGRPRLDRVEPGDRSLHLKFRPASDAGSPAEWEICFRDVGPLEDVDFLWQSQEEEDEEDGAGGFGGGSDFDEGAGGAGGMGGDDGFADGGAGGDDGSGGAGGSGGDDGAGGDGGSLPSFVPDACAKRIGGTARGYHLKGLTNDHLYEVAVRAIDDKGNQSDFSAVREGIPQQVDDFWRRYKQAGGDEEGGCSAAPSAGVAGILVASTLWLVRRRTGRCS